MHNDRRFDDVSHAYRSFNKLRADDKLAVGKGREPLGKARRSDALRIGYVKMQLFDTEEAFNVLNLCLYSPELLTPMHPPKVTHPFESRKRWTRRSTEETQSAREGKEKSSRVTKLRPTAVNPRLPLDTAARRPLPKRDGADAIRRRAAVNLRKWTTTQKSGETEGGNAEQTWRTSEHHESGAQLTVRIRTFPYSNGTRTQALRCPRHRLEGGSIFTAWLPLSGAAQVAKTNRSSKRPPRRVSGDRAKQETLGL